MSRSKRSFRARAEPEWMVVHDNHVSFHDDDLPQARPQRDGHRPPAQHVVVNAEPQPTSPLFMKEQAPPKPRPSKGVPLKSKQELLESLDQATWPTHWDEQGDASTISSSPRLRRSVHCWRCLCLSLACLVVLVGSLGSLIYVYDPDILQTTRSGLASSTPGEAQGGEAPEECFDYIETSEDCVSGTVTVYYVNCNPKEGDWFGVFPSSTPSNALSDPILWSWACLRDMDTQECEGGQGKKAHVQTLVFPHSLVTQGGNYQTHLLRLKSDLPPYTSSFVSSSSFSLSYC